MPLWRNNQAARPVLLVESTFERTAGRDVTPGEQERFDTAVEGLMNAALQMEATGNACLEAGAAFRELAEELEEKPGEPGEDCDGRDEDYDDGAE